MERIEELRAQYYESIKLLQNEYDILSSLPKPEYESFFSIINGIIKTFEEDIEIATKELQITPVEDIEMQEYIEDEIKSLKYKRDICIKLLEKGMQEKQIEEGAKEIASKKIIFATTEMGNIHIENDMKNIPEEYYETIGNLITELQGEVDFKNPSKAKRLTTTNKKLSKLQEIKDFKIRVFYKNLSIDTIYVLMVRMKKADNDSIDKNEIIDRASQTNRQYQQLKEEIKDPLKKAELIEQHQQIKNRIFNYIKTNKR